MARRSRLAAAAVVSIALVAALGGCSQCSPPSDTAGSLDASGASGGSAGPASSDAMPGSDGLEPSDAPPHPAQPADLTEFTYSPPGELHGSGAAGVTDPTVYVPGMRFPFQTAKAFANSQVYGYGGLNGPAGGQCDGTNYAYPWHDNFCEVRGYSTPLCPAGTGHQGQDIRPGVCKAAERVAVAAEDGTITQIGTYTVYLSSDTGRTYLYLHMKMNALNVALGDRVTRGQPLGLVSNDFGATKTTIHLHFEIKQPVTHNGATITTRIPPYTSLVDSYQRLLAGNG